MNIKRIFTDMDGTLLNSEGRVSQRQAELIATAGIPITLVSARAPMEMREAIDTLGLTGTQIAFNGGLIFHMDNSHVKPLHTDTIKQAQAQMILQHVRKYFPHISLSYYDLNAWYCDKIDTGIAYEQKLTRQVPTLIHDEEAFLAGCLNTFKIVMITFDEAEMLALEKYLQSLSHESLSIQRSGKAYLEITSHKAKKSQGIKYIFQHENLLAEETATFGDGHNDLPMLELVGYPIVIANALDDIKRIAYKVTKTNDEDGVGYGIHHFLKGNK